VDGQTWQSGITDGPRKQSLAESLSRSYCHRLTRHAGSAHNKVLQSHQFRRIRCMRATRTHTSTHPENHTRQAFATQSIASLPLSLLHKSAAALCSPDAKRNTKQTNHPKQTDGLPSLACLSACLSSFCARPETAPTTPATTSSTRGYLWIVPTQARPPSRVSAFRFPRIIRPPLRFSHSRTPCRVIEESERKQQDRKRERKSQTPWLRTPILPSRV